jgi:hypothetical protein
MAIDFGRMFRNVATGYLSAKIANTEANDALNANIIERAGLNFYENTLPEWEAGEKVRKETYNKVSSRYGKDVANYMDQNGFTDYNEIVEMLGANNNINETKLKAYLEETSAGTYAERAEKRASKIQNKEKTIMGLTSGSSKIGNMTAELLLKDDETATDAGTGVVPETTTEEVTIPGEMVPGTPIKTMDTKETREVPVESKASKLPTYEEIFGDTTGAETNFFALDLADREKLQGQSDQQYKTIFTNKVTGMVEHPRAYEEAYNNLPDNEKNKQTLQQYSYNRYFRERYLPESGFTYGAVSEGPKENSFVTAARYTINILKANDPNDPSIDEIKADLKERLGTNDLSPYGL